MATTKKKTQKRTSVGEDVENVGSLCAVGGSVKWHYHRVVYTYHGIFALKRKEVLLKAKA